MNMTRRALLGATAVALPVALAGCGIVTSTTVNGVTTVTVNVAKLDAYAKAVQNGTDALLANPLIAGAMGAGVAVAVAAALTGAADAISAIDKQANGSQTLTFSATNVPAALTSLQSNATTIYDDVQTAFTTVAAKLPATVAQAFSALETVVALLLAVMPTVAVAKAALKGMPVPRMPEARALAILHA